MEINKIGIHIAYKHSIISPYHQSIKVIPPEATTKKAAGPEHLLLIQVRLSRWKVEMNGLQVVLCFVHRKTTLFIQDSKIISYGTTSSHLWFTPIYIAKSLGPSKIITWDLTQLACNLSNCPFVDPFVKLACKQANEATSIVTLKLKNHDSMHRFMG